MACCPDIGSGYVSHSRRHLYEECLSIQRKRKCIDFLNFPVRQKLSKLMTSSEKQIWRESRRSYSNLPQSLGESSLIRGGMKGSKDGNHREGTPPASQPPAAFTGSLPTAQGQTKYPESKIS